MSAIFSLRALLLVAIVGLVAALGIQTDWGDALTGTLVKPHSVTGKQDSASVLPDFRLSSEANAYAQISERPLLNPSRRPAPTQLVQAAPEPSKPQVRRGLYQLLGITDLGNVKIAQVREVATNRVSSVREGDPLQEMKVTKVEPSQVTLAFQGETDILELSKFTASGRVPPPPAVPQPVAQQAPPPQPAQPQAQPPGARAAGVPTPNVPTTPPGTDPLPTAIGGAQAVVGAPAVAAQAPVQGASEEPPKLKFPGAGENSPIPGRVTVAEILEARRRARGGQ
jgi:hypothetical protein